MEPSKKTNACLKHPSNQKECFCLKCKKLFCHDCYKNDISHKSHILPLSNELLANYSFEQYLGEGSFGFVFRVISLSDDLPYALKIINDVDDYELFSKEIKRNIKMSHPNFIKYHTSFIIKSEKLFVIILELAHRSLELEIKSLSQSTAINYFIQIMEALRYLHDELKIVHRNLKLTNIFIKKEVIKLCDTGEALFMNNKKIMASNSSCDETSIYLPPEVLRGQKYNEKSDVWAAGIVFHAMLSKGNHPFEHDGTNNQNEIMKNIKSQKMNLDESIQDPKCLTILTSPNYLIN